MRRLEEINDRIDELEKEIRDLNKEAERIRDNCTHSDGEEVSLSFEGYSPLAGGEVESFSVKCLTCGFCTQYHGISDLLRNRPDLVEDALSLLRSHVLNKENTYARRTNGKI
ncbi:hypothetical protein [Proteus phage RP7]|nr:hypothetical protein [Proteus phage RP7]